MEAASTALQDSSADAVGPREDSRKSLSPAEAVSRELADVKTKIGKTETDIDKVALLIEALEKVEDANTLTPQQSSKLAYLHAPGEEQPAPEGDCPAPEGGPPGSASCVYGQQSIGWSR
jgi:hypothetical protein